MQYPTIPRTKALTAAAGLLASNDHHLEDAVVMEGTGEAIDLKPISELARSLSGELDQFRSSGETDLDLFEGRIAERVHSTLTQLPISVLDDPGFWRYLALAEFWWLATWREASAFNSTPGDTGSTWTEEGPRSASH